MKLFILGALILTSVSSFAALPPNYESARRIKAVLESEAVMSQVDGWIESIQHLSGVQGLVLTSQGCAVQASVTCGKMPGHIVGPCPLIVKVGKKQCTESTELE